MELLQAAINSGEYEPVKNQFEEANEGICPLEGSSTSKDPTPTPAPVVESDEPPEAMLIPTEAPGETPTQIPQEDPTATETLIPSPTAEPSSTDESRPETELTPRPGAEASSGPMLAPTPTPEP